MVQLGGIVNNKWVPDKVVKMTLTSKEFVNLALGRPINQALDPKHEVFALAVAFDDPTDPDTHVPDLTPNSKFILWDPDPPQGQPKLKQVLATISELDYDEVAPTSGWKGQGIGTMVIPEGPAGDNKFFPTTLRFSARGAAPDMTEVNLIKKFTLTVTGLQGRVRFQFKKSTPAGSPLTEWWAVLLKGTASTSGNRIGDFIEP